ncbi:hypothetical protein [Clostridioides difficile]|nr:hypothetical protein [Clostridioides difficile]
MTIIALSITALEGILFSVTSTKLSGNSPFLTLPNNIFSGDAM